MSDQNVAKRMADLTQRLRPLLTKEGLIQTEVDDILLMHSVSPSPARPIIYRPAVCFMLQGAKELLVGNTRVTYEQMNYLLIPVMLPVSGRVSQASADKPYVGLSFNFDSAEIRELILLLGNRIPATVKSKSSLCVGTVDSEMMRLLERTTELLENPNDAPIVLPLIRREMMYRLLLGELGGLLRDFNLINSQASRIAQVIDIIKRRLHEPLRVKDLAEAANLSESALYQAFKSVTSMSPIQFQKKLRLDEARRIMLFEGMDVSTACYQVGYESPSQFSREYSRLFGRSPKADIDNSRMATGNSYSQLAG